MTHDNEGSAQPDGPREEFDAASASRSSNVRFVVATVLVVTAVAWLAFSSFEDEVYFYTVAEAAERLDDLEGREFRVKGDVVRGTHMVREGTLDEHLFVLQAEGRTLEVFYDGVLPDTFSDEAEVVALGTLESPDRFVAVEVVAKCPSRYDEQPPTATTAGL